MRTRLALIFVIASAVSLATITTSHAYPAACSYSNFKSKIIGDRERCEDDEFDGGVRFKLKDRTVTIHYGESQGTWSRRKLNGQWATFTEENREAFSGTSDDLNEVFEYDSNPSALAKLPKASSARRELPVGVKGWWVPNRKVCEIEGGISSIEPLGERAKRGPAISPPSRARTII